MESYESRKSRPEIKLNNEAYGSYVMEKMPKTRMLSNCIRAFCVGGGICMAGQGLIDLYSFLWDMTFKEAAPLASITLVMVAATLTGLGVFDIIGKFSGAGSAVPITGFSNSIVSAAMEHKREGLIMGVGANLFKIAGPVLVNGISLSVIYGIIYFLITEVFSK